MTIKELFERMPDHVNESAIEGVDKTIQFNVTGDEPGNYSLVVQGGEVEVQAGEADDPDATINTDSDVWLKISRGELNGAVAFMTGEFTAEGDVMLLMSMQSWFDLPNS
ncbi:MAG: SCP2 sterol-binding domain-containing protein [Ardenticatenaceae bacterium]